MGARSFGARLAAERERRGMGRGELATHLGVSSQMIRAIEGGRRRPSWALFGRIVDVLGWDVVKRADLEAELRLPDVEAAP